MSQIAVWYGFFDAMATGLHTCANNIRTAVTNIQNEAKQLDQTWTGQASSAFNTYLTNWAQGCNGMAQVCDDLANSLNSGDKCVQQAYEKVENAAYNAFNTYSQAGVMGLSEGFIADTDYITTTCHGNMQKASTDWSTASGSLESIASAIDADGGKSFDTQAHYTSVKNAMDQVVKVCKQLDTAIPDTTKAVAQVVTNYVDVDNGVVSAMSQGVSTLDSSFNVK